MGSGRQRVAAELKGHLVTGREEAADNIRASEPAARGPGRARSRGRGAAFAVEAGKGPAAADSTIQHLSERLLESATCRIHVPSMRNLHNRHHSFGVVYLVKDPIYVLPQPVPFLPGKLLATNRSRILGQPIDTLHDPSDVSIGKHAKILRHRVSNANPIFSHAL